MNNEFATRIADWPIERKLHTLADIERQLEDPIHTMTKDEVNELHRAKMVLKTDLNR